MIKYLYEGSLIMFMYEEPFNILKIEIYISTVHSIEYFLYWYDILTILYVCY